MKSMNQIWTKIISVRFIRFAMVGVVATVTHYGAYLSLLSLLSLEVSYTVGYIVSFCCNFYLSARFSFRTDISTKRGIGFAVSHLVNYGIQIGLLKLLVLGLNETLAPLAVYAIAIPINYFMLRYVFRTKDSQQTRETQEKHLEE